VIRLLFAGLATAALIAVAVFFADHPGQVDILWRDWEIETSVGILVAAAGLASVVLLLLLRLIWLILGGPRALLRHRRERRRRAGLRALTRGMIAVAAGDPKTAQRHARDADRLLADPSLTLFLSAEAARLDGNPIAAKKFFGAMLERRETEFAGLRGLFDQALRERDDAAALRLAERARLLRPDAPWVIERLFDLEVQEGRWEAARETLAAAEKRSIVSSPIARHRRGVVLYELSRAAERRGERRQAISLAAQAQALTADLAAPAAHHARLLLQDGRTGGAVRAIERVWQTAPQPELAATYAEIFRGRAPLDRLKSFERLAEQNPAVRESYLAAAEAALEARLWGEARRHLERALTAPAPPAPGDAPAPPGPSARLCLLWARLEEAEHGDPSRLREWLDRALAAVPDPAYICTRCGGESRDWCSLCPHCASFDALAWRTPPRGGVAGRLMITAERLPMVLPTPSPVLSSADAADS